MTKVDKHQPGDKWAFNDSVTDVFEDMLQRSIPQYEVMRKAVADVASQFITNDKYCFVVDMGCSKGDSLADLVARFDSVEFAGFEISKPMLEAAQARFADDGNVTIFEHDIRNPFLFGGAKVIMSILTIQFTPIEYRQQIIQNVYDSLLEGGAFVIVEKVLGDNAQLNNLMVENYYQLKRQNGYTLDDIDRKRHSLEGVLVPVTGKWNEELLRQAGFSKVDCFWRWMNFAGWVAIK